MLKLYGTTLHGAEKDINSNPISIGLDIIDTNKFNIMKDIERGVFPPIFTFHARCIQQYIYWHCGLMSSIMTSGIAQGIREKWQVLSNNKIYREENVSRKNNNAIQFVCLFVPLIHLSFSPRLIPSEKKISLEKYFYYNFPFISTLMNYLCNIKEI